MIDGFFWFNHMEGERLYPWLHMRQRDDRQAFWVQVRCSRPPTSNKEPQTWQ